MQPLHLWSQTTFHSLQITAMWSYWMIFTLITKWNPVRGLPVRGLMITSSMGDDTVGQTVMTSVPLPSWLLCFFFHAGCGMLVESFLLSVFFLFFPAIPHFMCIYCYFHTYNIRDFPVYVWLLVMYHWLSVPNCSRELCSPSDLYMPVHPMCNNHCIAFDVSPPLWLSKRLRPFCKSTVTILWQH